MSEGISEGIREVHKNYKCDFDEVLGFLSNGLDHLSEFIQRFNGIPVAGGRCQDDSENIANILFPLIEKAKIEFDENATYAERLLQKINSDFEGCVDELERKNCNLKKIDSQLKELKEELKGKESAVKIAKGHYKEKEDHLSNATKTLSDAKRNLETENGHRKGTHTVASITTILFAFVSFVCPPVGIPGMILGFSGVLASAEILKKRVSMLSENVDSVTQEVESSQNELKTAENKKRTVENELHNKNQEKQKTEINMEKAKTNKHRLEEYRNLIITFAEDYKKFHHKLCDFHGKFKVLRCETSGGYNLLMLQTQTIMIGVSLSSLKQCAAITALCEQPMQACISKLQQQIDSVKWQTSDQGSEIDDII